MTELNTGTLAIEILDESGEIVDDPEVQASDDTVKVKNETGQTVRMKELGGSSTHGIVIPDQESRGIKRKPSQPLKVEFVVYKEDIADILPGQILIGDLPQTALVRELVGRGADGGGSHAEDISPSNVIVLRVSPPQGLQLWTGP